MRTHDPWGLATHQEGTPYIWLGGERIREALAQRQPRLVAEVAGVGIALAMRQVVAAHQCGGPAFEQWPDDRVRARVIARADLPQR